MSRSHPLAGRKSIRLADCANYSFVFADATLTSRRIFDKAFRRSNARADGIVTTNSIDVMKTLVREHQQVAFLARADVHADLIDGELVHVPITDRHVRSANLSLIARRHTLLSPVAALLAEHLKEQLQQLPGK